VKLEKANGLVTSEEKLNKDDAVEVEIIGEVLPGEIMFNLNHHKGTSHYCETSFRFKPEGDFIKYPMEELGELIDMLGEPADKQQIRKILNSDEGTKEE
jgi:xylose isomerase